MPFLLLDDATDEATRRLQEFGQGLLKPITTTIEQAGQTVQPGPQVVPPGAAVPNAQAATQRLQDFGSSLLQPLIPQAPTQIQEQPGIQDITQRLQDHGQQLLNQATQAAQQATTQLLPQPQEGQLIGPGAQQAQANIIQPSQSLGIQGPTANTPGDLIDQARQAAQKAGIDPDIFARQIQQESGFRPDARSPAGALGIAQFMPDTARQYGVDPVDPSSALPGAARMMKDLLTQYGGDWGRALAAYNGGDRAVQQLDAGHPWQETQGYLNNILGGAKNVVQQGVSTAQQAVQTAQQAVSSSASNVLPAVSQFGDKQLSAAEAYAACGPAAAVRFAQMFGRQPTLREATDLAQQVGWTPDSGMAGLGSESKLFDKMQIPHRMVGADWQALAREAQSGNPVTMSTPGHYFTADNYDPQSGAFHVGSSGTDLKGGSEWMTPAQMEARMGALQGGMAVDNPQVPGPSPLSQGAQMLGQAGAVLGGAVQRGLQDLTAAADPARGLLSPLARGMSEALAGVQSPGTGNPLLDIAGTAASALGTGASELSTGLRNITPSSELSRQSLGMEQLISENRGLYDQQQQLVDQFAEAQDRGDQDAMNRIAQQMAALQQQLPDTKNRDVLLQAADRNPSTPLVETGANLAAGAAAAPLAAEGAPLAVRAVATAIDPATGLPSVIGPALRSRMPAQATAGAASGTDVLDFARRGLGLPGEAASRFGSLVASALGPVENLPTDTAGVLRNYANMIGRQSDAARVMAENQLRSAGARLDIPAVAAEVGRVRGELRDDAARKLVAELQGQGKAAPIGNAPPEFRTVTDNPNTYLANYAFSPDVVAPIKAATDMSDIAANPLGSAVLKTIGTAKGTLFSLSNFHTLTEGLNAAFTSPETLANYARAFLSDRFAQGLRGSMADTMDAAARAGVTGLAEHMRPEDVGSQLGNAVWRRVVAGGVSGLGGAAAGYTETKLTGGTEEEARANAAKGGVAGLALAGIPVGARGTIPEILQSALWDRAVPLAKATAWDGLVKGGMDPGQAADVINQRFGGLNYAAMGRNPTLLDAQRLTLMASDWNEATVRQLGSAIFGGDGSGVTRGFLAKTIAGMMATTEALNYALSGHSTLDNEPGHQFEVEVPNPNGGSLHFGILPGNVQAYLNLANTEVSDPSKRGTAPTNFIVNRLSAPVGAGIDAALAASGRPPFQIAKAGPIAVGENVAPIGVSQVLQSTLRGGMNPLAAAGLAAAGLNPRYSAGGGGGGGFRSPTTRAPLPSRTPQSGQSRSRAPVPRR